MTYRNTALATAIITFLLGTAYLLAGHLVVGRWNVEPTDGVLLMGRRMGAVYLGLSVMFFLTRNAGASAARTGLCAGAFVTVSLLGLLGVYEFALGQASRGILVSAAIELLLAIAFGRLLWEARHDARPAAVAPDAPAA
jgi:hypothetical protein